MHSSDRAIEGELYGMENGGSRTIQKNRVRELRENRLMTQAQLAEKVGVTRQTLHAIEAAKYSPTLELAFRIAAVFGVPLDEVFQYDENG